MKKALLIFISFIIGMCCTAHADQITILNAALNGGSYPWDTARADINNNFNDLYGHWSLITVTTAVDLDAMDALIDANVTQVSEFVTLSGMPAHSTSMGLFSGVTIPDNSDIKVSLQALETAVEGKADALGIDDNYVTDAQLVIIGNTSGTNSGNVTIGTANGLSLIGQVLSLSAATNLAPGAMTAAFVTNLESLVTLSGMAADSTDYGTFTGVTIPDGSDGKESLQALETALELVGTPFDPASPGEIGGTTPAKATFTEIEIPFVDNSAGLIWPDANTNYPGVVGTYGVVPEADGIKAIINGVKTTIHEGDTAVTPGSYTAANITVDQEGHITAAANGSGGAGITTVTTDPDMNDLTNGQAVFSKASGDFFYRADDGTGLFTTLGTFGLYYLLTVTDPGNNNYIQSTDTFINCGNGATDCTYLYPSGATPQLTATADALYTWDNWTGDASDTSTTTNPDTWTMSAAKSVGAAFTALPTCATDSVTTANDGAVIAAGAISTTARGQIFQVATANPISSIEFFSNATTAGAEVEMRWGQQADLSSNYETTNVTILSTDDGVWRTATFANKVVPATATPLYFALVLVSGDIQIGSHNNNPYADGTMILASAPGFVLDAPNATYDLMFRIRQCD